MNHILNYQILEEKYNSPRTAVFLVEDKEKKEEDRLVIKVLNNQYPTVSDIADFKNDFEVTRQLSNEGTRKILNYQKKEGKHLLEMEYFPSITLREAIEKGEINTIEAFLKVASQLAGILVSVHKAGFVHKDVKPDNILYGLDHQEIRLIDFGIASKINLEKIGKKPETTLVGSLEYIAPEQTGRMNRGVDYRADLYALGVTLFEVLAGETPFKDAKDHAELIHAHIAKMPPLVGEVSEIQVPDVISEILAKLLEKNVENRYQSAIGVQSDFDKCLRLLASGKPLISFEIGEFDGSDQFRLSDRLYGREESEAILLQKFEDIRKGGSALLLVKGYSGIGKSALVQELEKPVSEAKGYFLRGKHDQFQRDTPYTAFIQVIDDFIEQVLTEPVQSVSEWKSKILRAVGNNGQVIIDVVKKLELVIGQQPPIPELPAMESQNRFDLVFQSFIRAISTEKHPVVLFMDDIQWADEASLKLLHTLMTDAENRHFLIIGAYRDNEVNESHPLTLAIQKIEQEIGALPLISLKPLSEGVVIDMLSEILQQDAEKVRPLAAIIHYKTAGNPFFIGQFLKMLYAEGHIYFHVSPDQGSSVAKGQWMWQLPEIERLEMTSNVVDLMMAKIKKLSPVTQKALQLASCIGSSFSLKMLSFLLKLSQKQTQDNLMQAIEEGLVQLMNGDLRVVTEETDDFTTRFAFAHDRIQQAANAMLSKEEREEINWLIGCKAKDKNDEGYVEDNLMEIVGHLNKGARLATDLEKQELAVLNLKAAKKAKKSTAYQAAVAYLDKGIDLIPTDHWKTNYAFTFELCKEKAECEYLCGNYKEAEIYFEKVKEKSANIYDTASILLVKLHQYVQVGKYMEAIEVGIEALTLFGVEIDMTKAEQQFGEEIGLHEQLMADKQVQDLYDWPVNPNQEDMYIMSLAGNLILPSFIVQPLLYPLLLTKIVNLSIQNGHTSYSALGFSFFAGVKARMGQYQTSYEIGQLAIALNEKFDNQAIIGKIYYAYTVSAMFFSEPLPKMLGYYHLARQMAMENGDLLFTGFAHSRMTKNEFIAGKSLLELLESSAYRFAFLQKSQSPFAFNELFLQTLIQNLVAKPGETSFSSEQLDEHQLVAAWKEGGFGTGVAFYYLFKAENAFFYEFDEEALEHIDAVLPYLPYILTITEEPYFYFLQTLIYTRNFHKVSEEQQEVFVSTIEKNLAFIEKCQEACAENFAQMFLLMKASLAEIRGELGVLEYYQEAIIEAERNDMNHFLAIANEQVAKYCLGRKFTKLASKFMQDAFYYYRIWGAKGKVTHLHDHYDYLLSERKSSVIPVQETTRIISETHHTTRETAKSIDVSTIMKASERLATEVSTKSLLSTMLSLFLENVGAERGVVLLKEASGLSLMAHRHIAEAENQLLDRLDYNDYEALPKSIVNYVLRTQEALVLDSATNNANYNKDEYIVQHELKSVLCYPIISKTKLLAIIYLENNLAAGVFTKERISVLNLLAGQIAISLENADLYENLEDQVHKRTEELRETNSRITQSISYAQTLQQAILPTSEHLDQLFEEHFVLYRPKDIVSGDFYWVSQQGDYRFVATVDCTGHGVPGAFMSMIGNTLLNEIINSKHVFEPSEILEQLNIAIQNALNQAETTNKDGMDICLCRLKNLPNQTVEVVFAGAKRPLWYYHPEKMGIQVVAGTRKGIGGFFSSDKSFGQEKMEFPIGTVLYLTSDGFEDQNNARGRKFTSKVLKDWLFSQAKRTLVKQCTELKRALNQFQGEEDQRDDITMLGIKL